ncbi:M10 family metallopeptidase C-terminal domain-containing protein [Synechococcus sp. MIT S1220]|uniref:M10 family metallopeptidase C-terminal domain-containing protein n=1 Tax=Synechococcus sp. MIT S1220 TaxID=3082549 RepID=UPI0039B0E8AA
MVALSVEICGPEGQLPLRDHKVIKMRDLREWLTKTWYDHMGDYADCEDWDTDLLEGISGPVRWKLTPKTIRYRIRRFDNPDAHDLIDEALKTWHVITGIKFKKVRDDEQITFVDEGNKLSREGLLWGVFVSDDTALSYVDEDWLSNLGGSYKYIRDVHVFIGRDRIAEHGTAYRSVNFQTILHEIGHALGLGHPGPYNSSDGGFWNRAIYLNDNKALSLMSYWHQNEMRADPNVDIPNLEFDSGYKILMTPNIVDLMAFNSLYWNRYPGTHKAFTGNTKYGKDTNISARKSLVYNKMYDWLPDGRHQYTIFDAAGMRDELNFPSRVDSSGNPIANDQIIDLRSAKLKHRHPYYSSVLGGKNNLIIGEKVTIEVANSGEGNDEIIGNYASNTLRGSGGNDTIMGLGGPDFIHAGDGVDSLLGGKDNDVYKVTHRDDTIVEKPRQGLDRVISLTPNYTLSDNVEELSFLDPNYLGNILFTGSSTSNTIFGASGDDQLRGRAGIDFLSGHHGDDLLDGGLGSDRLYGGSGDDKYLFSPGDTLVEKPNEGTDTVIVIDQSYRLRHNFEKISYAQIESEGLTLSGNNEANSITYDDTLIIEKDLPGHVVGSSLVGKAGDDELIGSPLNDTLDGGSGADVMQGGQGDDTYYYSSTEDQIEEESDSGTDTILASVDLNMLYTPNIENAQFVSDIPRNIIGNANDNILSGNLEHNVLLGGDGNDSLTGGFGNDSLDGGSGADTLFGGSGQDQYTIRGINDVIQDSEMNTDVDHIKSYVSFSLVANRYGQVRDIENLSLLGNQAAYAYGNSLDNRITGNNVDNTLIGFGGMDIIKGGLGADRITGGDDSDTFMYSSISESPSRENDVITDFDRSQFDVIDLTDIDANVNIAGDQAFELSLSSELIPKAGTAIFNSSTKMLNLYVDSTVLPSMSIEIPSVDFLRSSDLYL